MDEPVEEREIRSLICETFPDDDTDAVCRIKTVVPTRTFLEKIFLLAEEFQKDKPRSMRMSRHLYDLERLMDSEFGKSALADKTLYNTIIEHRQAYYAIRYVDYSLHHPDTINILPQRMFRMTGAKIIPICSDTSFMGGHWILII